MLKRLKTILTSRTFVVGLILLLTASLVAAALVPQATPGRAASVGILASVIRLLGLDHVFSSCWFAGLASLFALSLALSTRDQYRLTRKKLCDAPSGGEEGFISCSAAEEDVMQNLSREGYRLLVSRDGVSRYVKGRVGYWGNFFLHLGLAVTVASSVVYVLTEHRMIIRCVEREEVFFLPGMFAERKGFLARPLPLPEKVVLEGVDAEFHETDAVDHVTSHVLFIDGENGERSLSVGQSDKQDYRGLIIYQQNTFGLYFALDFMEPGKRPVRTALQLPLPVHRDKAAYGKADLDNGRYLLKAKYFSNVDRSGMLPRNPQLVLRLYEGTRMLGEVTLLRGESARLGPYEVRLGSIRWWSDILIEGSRGMVGIFIGFGVLLWGCVLSFFIVPREIVLRSVRGEAEIRWRPARFRDFYQDEWERIHAACGAAGEPVEGSRD